ncbi:S8 family serine peptidase [Paraconexibacter sp. AEG42_29]|uniref:S8 family peptidase n=1 Tax=Paraconexibacter sp. AEG42_29 TaxID=2997339 RepID=UPI00339D6BAA
MLFPRACCRSLFVAAASLSLLIPATAPAQASDLAVPPMVLPGTHTARAAATGPDGLAAGWIVGARPGARTVALAARHGARRMSRLGTYLVPTRRAARFAAELRRIGALDYAEPNVRKRPSAFEADPAGWSRGAIAAPALALPPIGSTAVAVIDDRVDATMPDLVNTTFLPGSTAAVTGPHGTEVASVVGAAADGQGVLGTFPGVRIASFGVPDEFGCAESAAGIDAARRAGVAAINMSYGSTYRCYSEYRELQYAFAAGIVAVASAGNEFEEGNPVTYPAALPHVVSVAAVDRDLTSSYFSTANAAVDLSAPGAGVPVDRPLAFDTSDGIQDGFSRVDGTSFAAPAVAGAAAILAAARPDWGAGQLADALRFSARDIGDSDYDYDTGFGLLDVRAALALRQPEEDPGEPNDEVMWVNGVAFDTPDPPIFTGVNPRTVSASVDQVEDPLDVYRVRILPRQSVRITLTPSFGDPDLQVLRPGARSTSDPGRTIVTSRRNGTRIDSAVVRNGTPQAAVVFVAVEIDGSVDDLDAAYRLTVRRAPRR